MNKKYAVCIGNNYPGTNAQLSGCVNDASDWKDRLSAAGYECLVLLESTKAQAVEALTEVVAKAGFGDRVVFTYSGHGTWVPDRSGDEADGRDEALAMADYANGGLLLDDELQQIFAGLRGGSGALVLSDSCHSGTVSRLAGILPYARAVRPRFLSPEFFTDLSPDEVRSREAVPASNPRATASLISGCGDLEYSYDAWFTRNGEQRANGAFSRRALDTYTPGISLGNWFKAIRTQLPNSDYPQSPQLTVASLYRRYARAL